MRTKFRQTIITLHKWTVDNPLAMTTSTMPDQAPSLIMPLLQVILTQIMALINLDNQILMDQISFKIWTIWSVTYSSLKEYKAIDMGVPSLVLSPVDPSQTKTTTKT